MALKIERYRPSDYEAEMEPDEEGEWVRYEDHEDMLYLAERRPGRQSETDDEVETLRRMLRTSADDVVRARGDAAGWKAKWDDAQDTLTRWRAAWEEGDAIRTKLQARIDEVVGERRAADARATKAETELAEARAKLGSVGWVHDEMEKACPGWKRAFVASVGDRWMEGKTTTAEQLAFVLTTLAEAARRRGAYSFEEG